MNEPIRIQIEIIKPNGTTPVEYTVHCRKPDEYPPPSSRGATGIDGSRLLDRFHLDQVIPNREREEGLLKSAQEHKARLKEARRENQRLTQDLEKVKKDLQEAILEIQELRRGR